MFGTLNYLVLLLYLAGMIGIGIHFSRRQENSEMFFLGGRKLPWLAVAMSMYASLTSAVTYIGLPGTAYAENISLIIVSFMSPIVAPFILLIFYPLYHRLRVTTSYEYILKRFGAPAKYAVASLFLLARLGWLGTVVYAPAMAMSTVTGIPLWICICMMGLLATVYTALGGLAAVVWTDAIQFIILIGGAVWVSISLIQGVEGGAGAIIALAGETGRLDIGDWKINLFSMTGPAVAISFFFQLMQDYGTDQITVQRLMATGSLKKTVKSVAFNACTDFFIIGLLMFIGLGLFAFFQNTELPAGITPDKTMPYYIIHYLPQGISGLLITAVFAAAMSSMDSGINSIATVLISDFTHGVKNEVRLARQLTLALGLLATALAFYVSTIGGILKAFFSFMGMFSAPVLALFLMGALTQKGNFKGWLIGLGASIAVSIWIQKFTPVHELYYFPASFFVSFSIGLIASRFFQPPEVPSGLTVWKR
ncbi:sodium:solute symporter family transporter [Pontiella agarivorans]|uniref:Sodium/solute symporter n=1 Tax=Pontiella agarivorans TaxID=3038953 RepID=A0ABU5MXQ4_9BACT|nr:sodium/solute symporter [Pontiella agarivorans]MDZ8118992.1 sodium/solute symporter [Pontiella agarivorans]